MSIVTMSFESHYLKSNHEISIILPSRQADLLAKDF